MASPYMEKLSGSDYLLPKFIEKIAYTQYFKSRGGGGGGVLHYMGYIGMCGAKEYGFSAALAINRVSVLAILPPFW